MPTVPTYGMLLRQVPFQCACKACNASHFKYWDNQYWTQDGPAKAMVLRMRQVTCPPNSTDDVRI
eukprot:3243460-Rhodomonas_salina.1